MGVKKRSASAALPSSTSTQRVVHAGGLRDPSRPHRVPAWEGSTRGEPASQLAAGEARGGAASEPVEPLAGEAGEETGTVQEAGAALRCGDGRPQVRFSEGRGSVTWSLSRQVEQEKTHSTQKDPRKQHG